MTWMQSLLSNCNRMTTLGIGLAFVIELLVLVMFWMLTGAWWSAYFIWLKAKLLSFLGSA
jgi:hypothetical protein